MENVIKSMDAILSNFYEALASKYDLDKETLALKWQNTAVLQRIGQVDLSNIRYDPWNPWNPRITDVNQSVCLCCGCLLQYEIKEGNELLGEECGYCRYLDRPFGGCGNTARNGSCRCEWIRKPFLYKSCGICKSFKCIKCGESMVCHGKNCANPSFCYDCNKQNEFAATWKNGTLQKKLETYGIAKLKCLASMKGIKKYSSMNKKSLIKTLLSLVTDDDFPIKTQLCTGSVLGATIDPKLANNPSHTIKSWNVACLKPSQTEKEGAKKWSEIEQVVTRDDPDVICLQEVDTCKGRELKGYKRFGNSIRSHSGYLMIYVKDGISAKSVDFSQGLETFQADAIQIQMDGTEVIRVAPHLPCVGVIIDGVTIVNVHLYPYGGDTFAEYRLLQFKNIVERCKSNKLIVIGDYNMRNAELSRFEEQGMTAVRQQGYTWDSITNYFHGNGHKFTCNFDRILYRGVVGETYCLFGNEPPYLSDHFGMFFRYRRA